MDPTESVPPPKSIPVDTARSAAAATPAPIMTLPLVLRTKPGFCSFIVTSSKKWTSRETRWFLVDFPGTVTRASTDSAANTPERQEGWRRPTCCSCGNATLSITESSKCSGGSTAGARPRSTNRRRSSSNCPLRPASDARRRSSSCFCSAVASPSRTACINCTCSDWFMCQFVSVCASPRAARSGAALPRTGGISPFSPLDPISVRSRGSCNRRNASA